MITITITITSVGVQHRDGFIPQTGVWRTPVGSSRAYVSVYLSVCLSVYLSARSSTSISGKHSCDPYLCAAHAAAYRGVKSPEWQYNISIRLSVCPSGHLRAFCNFCICIE